MKSHLRILTVILFLITVLSVSGQVSQVQYEIIYNPASCLYEAHAHVVGASLVAPFTIPFPSKFSVVVPAAISDLPLTVVQSVNPPGLNWVQGNSVYAPAADPTSDFHAFTMPGGGAINEYPVFTVGTDILLFKFSVPHVNCEDGIRCFINGSDPNSAAPGMLGLDFTQSFKTANVERYLSNTGSPIVLPKPTAGSSNTFSCNGNTLYLTSSGSSTLCNPALSYSWTGSGGFTSSLQNPSVNPYTAPGTYTVTLKDANGCTSTSSVTLSGPFQVLSAVAGSTPVNCYGASTGTATVTASGGVPGYSYLWNNGQVAVTATGLSAGTYTVTVTDAQTCTATATALVTQPSAALSATITAQTDVLCHGDAIGSATAAGHDGTPGYTYLWNNGQSLATANGLTQGTYTVTVTDANSCATTTTATITEPLVALSATITAQTDVLCHGDATGSATAAGHDGTPGYTYLWNNGQSLATANGLTQGTYTVTVTDANSCTTTTTAIITEPLVALSATITAQTDVLCHGDATGSATAAGHDGTPGYTYLWNNSQSLATAISLTAGTYTVTVKDANSCTTTTTATITEPLVALSATITTQTDELCHGDAIGSATAAGHDGTPGYTYLWNNGQSLATAISLTAGTYTVTVKDANSCATTTTATITEPLVALSATITAHTDVLCHGDATGSATAAGHDGTPGYTYLWNNGQSLATAISLTAGTYTVTVEDANSCTTTTTATITEPLVALSATITAHTDVLCHGDATGSATAAGHDGTPGYTYLWNNGQSLATANGLTQGTYTVTVTDANSCTTTTTATITEPLVALSATITAHTDVLCHGDATGSATAAGHDGTPGYTYLWNNGQSLATAISLTAGTYTVTVEDANSCTTTTTATITEPLVALSATITAHTDVLCHGDATGSATAAGHDGTPGYTYLWNNGQSLATAISLTAGTYTVTVEDANSCTTTTTASITEPLVALSATITAHTDVLCHGDATGSATAAGHDGTPDYTYLWNNGQSLATAISLTAGTYTVTVKDANSCVTTTTATITEPLVALSATITAHTDVLCHGDATGSATAAGHDGTPGYTYLWNNGQSLATAISLTAGTYTVTVEDANSCTTTTTATITEPLVALSATITAHTDVLCHGDATGSATAAGHDGTPGYTYLWNNGQSLATAISLTAGTYTVTVKDANSCTTTTTASITEPLVALSATITAHTDVLCHGDATGSATAAGHDGTPGYTYLWNNGQSLAMAISLTAGTYTVTVTDANSCTTTTTASITEPLVALSATITAHTDVLCHGDATGSATAAGHDGTPGYTYLWNNGQSLATAISLTAGTYTVTVEDANSCTTTTTATITEPLVALSATITAHTDVLCHGDATGSATAAGHDGTPGYTYLWNNGQSLATAISLTAGTYTVTVKDANSCTTTTTATITEPLVALSATITAHTDVLCHGDATGSATAAGHDGTPGYTYLWNNGQNLATAISLTAGTYTVTVEDANSCTTTTTATITEPLVALSATITAHTDVLCHGDATGSATAAGHDGTPGYTYLWNNGQSLATAISLTAGTYTVTVTDANSCTTTTTASITEPLVALSATITAHTDVLCHGDATGSATAAGHDGTPDYTYLWNNGQSLATAISLTAGTYTVTVKDANSCTTTTTASITEPLVALSATITAHTDVLCHGDATGSATAAGHDGTPGYTYLWNNGQSLATAISLTAGTYTVTVEDANSCTTTTTASITEPLVALSATITAHTDVLCHGDATGSATAAGHDGTPGYTYLWNNGQSLATAISLTAGTYTVTVKDANSCTTTTTASITEPLVALSATITAHTDVLCHGDATGSATAAGHDGTPGYTYLWNNGQSLATAISLTAGTYTVTVEDANSCTTTTTASITEPLVALSATITAHTDVLCHGDATGSATAAGHDGTPGYTYLWNNGQSLATAISLTAGTYTVTVKDANSCVTTTTATITEPLVALSATITAHTDVLCHGDATGSATAAGHDGTPGYTYLWNNGQSLATAISLTAGTYTVTVKDANSCITTTTASITEPLVALSATITAHTDVLCHGDATGSATAAGHDGTPGYTYLWNNGQSLATAISLTAGTYTVTVEDANSCTTTTTATITEPLVALSATITAHTDVLCHGDATGSATAAGHDGTPGYTYLWNNGQSLATAISLTAGTYTVTVEDANSCTTTTTASITEPLVALSATITAHTDVLCHGDATGSATAAGHDGTPGYTYLWNNGQSLATAISLTAGTYTVTVKDANSCVTTTTATITEPLVALSATITAHTDVLCHGDATGSATAAGHDGTPGYTYLWNNGQSLATAISLTAGTYTVTVEDANSCTTTTTASITEPLVALSATITAHTDVLCHGDATGSATAAGHDGTPGYTYLWNNGQSLATAISLTAGTYTVTVEDANSCTTTTTASITEPLVALSATITAHTDVLCHGDATGSATAAGHDGTPGYTYLWNNGQSLATAISLTAGTYTVTVKDANSCTTTTTASITEPLVALSATITAHTDVLCHGDATGSATAAGHDGTPGYTYLWNNGQSLATAISLTAGTYTVTVEDANSCTTTTTATITEPLVALSATITAHTDVLCHGDATGSATAAGHDGTPGYTYLWNNGQSLATAISLTAGTYTVTVKDANSCTTTTTASITEPLVALSATITAHTDVLCHGDATGSATAAGHDGTPGYTYLWNNGQSLATAISLTAGTYTVTVEDANSCTTTTTASITEPLVALSATITAHTDVLCHGDATGSATAAGHDGTPGYTYLWNNGQSLATAISLTAGTYTVTVEDANSCTTTTTASITEPLVALSATITAHTDVLCHGDATGSATAAGHDGTPGYTYLWNNGQSLATANGLTQGTYTVTVTDANSCTTTTTASITEPLVALSATITAHTDVLCHGDATGSATAAGHDGTPGYTYLWNNGQSLATAISLTAGTYTVTVEDANSCTTTTTASITEPLVALSATITAHTDVLCHGDATGSATAAGHDGTPGYTYLWNNGQSLATAISLTAGTYTVTVEDANSCTTTTTASITEPLVALSATITAHTDVLCHGDATGSATAAGHDGTPGYTYLWNNGQSLATAISLTAGTYTVTVKDANSCTTTTTASITEPLVALSATITAHTDVLCHGDATGSATAAGHDGTPGYTYLWNNGQSLATAISLTAGTYTVTVEDANSCTTTTTATITEPLVALSATITAHTDVLCHGDATGSATAAGHDGTPGYTYLWNNGQSLATAISLTAGTYTVTVEDANSCTTTTTATITEPLVALSATITAHTDVLCHGDATGSATAAGHDGTPGYTYLWNNGQSLATAISLTAGTYTVTVKDANSCTTTTTASITEPLVALSATITAHTDVLCHGDATGSATAAGHDGTPGYTYLWNNGQSLAMAISLTAGTYTVTVTDANSCTTTTTASITEPLVALSATITAHTDVLCHGDATGSATAAGHDGTPGYTYLWNNGQSLATAISLTAGTYTVTVEDANSCTTTTTATITEPLVALSATITAHTDVLCHGDATGSATAAGHDGTPGYTYLWNNGQSLATAISLTAGTYTVTVKDANSCTTTTTASITEPLVALSATITAHTDVLCHGDATGSATAAGHDGTPGYTYLWNNGQSLATAISLTAGTYTVTVKDANSCTTTTTASITEPLVALSATITAHTDVLCHGNATGSATAAGHDGTPGYTYLWNNGQSLATAISLTAGTYTVTVKDANSCTTITTASITEPLVALSATITAHTDVLCHGDATGSATAAGHDGTPGYTYLWNNGQGLATAISLTAGTYTVTVTDANTCRVTTTVEILQPSSLTATISAQTNVSTFGGNDGSATVSASGGTTVYSYLWNNGQSLATAISLTAGTYTVTVTDAHTCWTTATALITEPSGVLVVSITPLDVTCFGGNDGSATASVSGGVSPYSYLWNNGQTAITATGLTAGTYTVTVSDAITLTATASAVINQPDAITVDAGPDQQLCNQYITVLTGNWPLVGVGNWTLYHQPLGSPAVTIFPANSPIVTVMGLQPYESDHYVFVYTIKTGATCSKSDTMNVFDKHLPSSPYAGPDQNLCYKAPPLNVFYLAAGTPVYGTGVWTQVPGGPSAVIANPNATNTMVTYTTPGTYKFLWTVSNGVCAANDPDTAVIKVFAPPAVNAGPDIEICIGAVITLSGSSATGDCMTLLWTTSGTGTFNDPTILHPIYTPSAADLAAGSVTLTLTGTIGCCNPCGPAVVHDDMLLIFHPHPVPTALVVSNVTCNGFNNGSVTVTVTGGTTPYHYLWNDLLTQTTATATGLTAGTYTVIVTDNYSCQGTSSVTITEPSVLTISATATSVTCYTYSNGIIDLTAGGGTSPYFYAWNTGAHTPVITGLSAGTYSVTVTDSQSCPAYGQWDITEPPAWSVFISGPGSACCNTSEVFEYDASVDMTVWPDCCQGGKGIINPCVTYQWVVVGGTIVDGWNTDHILVHWNCCTQGTVTVTATRCDGCMLTTTIPVAVHLPPSPVVTGPASVDANSSTQYCALPAITGHTYSWSVIGGSYTSAPGSNCITVTWGPYPPCGCGKVIVCETDPLTGCTGCDTLYVTIQPVGQNLQGYVRYNNSYNTGLNGVKIRLRDKATGLIAGTVWSGPDTNPPNEPGYYAFTNILPGTYALDASYDGTWGGNNATDALIVQLNVIGSYPLYYLRDTVADVNASMTITGLDALYIKLRTIGSISSYPAGDWKFTDTTFIFGTSATINLKGLCVGDVNGSYIPEGFKETNSLSVMEDGVMTVPVGEPFIYNINSSRNAELGAMTLFLGYDPARFEVIDVTSAYDGMKYIAGDGRIAIAWADTKPLKVNTDDMVLRLNMRVKDKISEPSRVFTIRAGSEFADILARPYDKFDLKMANVLTSGGLTGITMYNYPNPFANTTTIVYTLPEPGHARLVLTDLYGKTIRTLADQLEKAGPHSVTVDPASLNMVPGIYLYKIIFDSATDTYVKVNKMVFTR